MPAFQRRELSGLKMYTRKPEPVVAVKLTEDNIKEVARWCGGDILSQREDRNVKYLIVPSTSVDVDECHIGDYVVYREEDGKFGTWLPDAFEANYVSDSLHIETEESEIEKDPSLYPDPDEGVERG